MRQQELAKADPGQGLASVLDRSTEAELVEDALGKLVENGLGRLVENRLPLVQRRSGWNVVGDNIQEELMIELRRLH